MFICILLMIIVSKCILLNSKVNQHVLCGNVKQKNREYYTFCLCISITKFYFCYNKSKISSLLLPTTTIFCSCGFKSKLFGFCFPLRESKTFILHINHKLIFIFIQINFYYFYFILFFITADAVFNWSKQRRPFHS